MARATAARPAAGLPAALSPSPPSVSVDSGLDSVAVPVMVSESVMVSVSVAVVVAVSSAPEEVGEGIIMPEEVVTVLVTVAVVAALVLGMETERVVERRLLQSSRALSWMSMSWSAWQESVKQLAWACMRSSRPEQMHSTSREPSQPISGRPRARHSVCLYVSLIQRDVSMKVVTYGALGDVDHLGGSEAGTSEEGHGVLHLGGWY